jgi:hypothetical protein
MSNPWDELQTTSDTRAPRSLGTREQTGRERKWTPKSRIPDPTPQDGWVFKWVRTGFPRKGEEDKGNYFNRLDEGWEPVNSEDHPEITTSYGTGSASGHVERGGLILCKMPLEEVQKRRAYYANITRTQTESVEEHALRDNGEKAMRKFVEKRKQMFSAR